MLRTLTLVAALTIAATPALVAGAVLVAPATTSAPSGNTAATSATTTTTAAASVATTGNGAPSGAHYNLNLIGVPKDKTADMTNNDGHRIFVQLTGGEDATSLKGKLFSEITRVNKIFLQPAPATRTRPTRTVHSSSFPLMSQPSGPSGPARSASQAGNHSRRPAPP